MLDYRRLAAPYLLQLQERQQDVIRYLSRETSAVGTDSAKIRVDGDV